MKFKLLEPLIIFVFRTTFVVQMLKGKRQAEKKNRTPQLQKCSHGVLTFRTEVMSPPNEKINCFFIWRHHRARIRWNLKDSSGEGFPL